MILPPILRADEVAAALDDLDTANVELFREQFARAFEEYGPAFSRVRILVSLCRCGTGMADVEDHQLIVARIARAFCGCLISGTPHLDSLKRPILAEEYQRDPIAFTTEVVRLVLRCCEVGALRAASERAAIMLRDSTPRGSGKKEIRATVARARRMLEIALEGEVS